VITEAIDEEKSTPEAEVYKKAINFEALKQLLGGDVAEGNEAYEFTWVGKKNPSLKPINPSEKPSVPAEPRLGDHPKHLY
jgi:adenine-specific DNA-methyltransferase